MKTISSICLLVLFLISWNSSYSQISKINTYGFFDTEVEISNESSETKKWAFDQHHLNVLVNYSLNNQFTIATEIEYEHVPDLSSEQHDGSIYLANAYLHYNRSNTFQVKIGKFMNPFGIYNERHDATPTFISTELPNSIYDDHELALGISGRLFAKHSTGIQVLGRFYTDQWGFKYKMYLSNGRGPNSGEKDTNFNKGLGFRLEADSPIEGLRFGTSFYTDKNGYINDIKQSALGFDIELEKSSYMIQTEFIYSKIENTGIDELPNGIFTGVMGYYIMGSYTFFNKLSPFVRYDKYFKNVKTPNNAENISMAGINFAISQSIFLKGEFNIHRFHDDKTKNFEIFISSIAVAF